MNARGRGNLPVEATSFVGRRRELGLARELMASARELTLVGPGGVGKTRLALQLARQSQRTFRDGVWLVDLSDLRQPDLLAQTIGKVLGVRDESRDPSGRLADYLADKHLLLLLDNCEHLAEATAVLIARLLTAASNLRVIATSQHVLGVEGEQVLPVPPLPYPSQGDDDPSFGGDGMDALTLFEERARAVDPTFRIDNSNRSSAMAICHRLDGMPLALELAAVRVRLLTVDQIFQRIDDAVPLLNKGQRSRPIRQQTLLNTLQWSFDLCSTAEQALWAQLAVFAGGFTVDAVEQVCLADEFDGCSEFEVLAGLVDKSIVMRMDTQDGGARYRLLEVVRQFGATKLAASGREGDLHLRHRDYMRRLACRFYTDYGSPRDVVWFSESRSELANIRAAMEFSLTTATETSAALEMAAALTPFWQHDGCLREGYGWLARALEGSTGPTLSRARALAMASFIGLLLGDTALAVSRLSECERLAERLSSDDVLIIATYARAIFDFLEGDLDVAIETALEAARRAQESENVWAAMECLTFAALLAFVDDRPEAPKLAAMQLEFAQHKGAHLNKAIAQWLVGLNHWRRDEHTEAVRDMRAAIRLFRRFPNPTSIATCIEGIAWSAASAGDAARAAQLIGAARNIWTSNDMQLAKAIIQRVGMTVENQVRATLGNDAFRQASDRGSGLSLREATTLALGGRLPADRPERQVREAAGLTNRELQIADLVARGLTNKEIAAKLVISTRTADSHVEHILRKLGFRSRTQIVSWHDQRRQAEQ